METYIICGQLSPESTLTMFRQSTIVSLQVLWVVYMNIQLLWAQGVTVTMYVDSTSINEGTGVNILCQLSGLMPPSNTIVIQQETTEGDKVDWVRDGVLQQDEAAIDTSVSVLNPDSDTTSHVLSFDAISRSDAGIYVCHAIQLDANGGARLLASDSVDVIVNYDPPGQYPTCHVNKDSSLEVTVGDKLEFSCRSKDSIPGIFLKWSHTNSKTYETIQRRVQEENGTVQATINVLAHEDLNGTYFICEIYSAAFSETNRTCSIGPISVIRGSVDAGPVPTTGAPDGDVTTQDSGEPNDREQNQILIVSLIATLSVIVVLVVLAIGLSFYCYRKGVRDGKQQDANGNTVDPTDAGRYNRTIPHLNTDTTNHYEGTPPTPRVPKHSVRGDPARPDLPPNHPSEHTLEREGQETGAGASTAAAVANPYMELLE